MMTDWLMCVCVCRMGFDLAWKWNTCLIFGPFNYFVCVFFRASFEWLSLINFVHKAWLSFINPMLPNAKLNCFFFLFSVRKATRWGHSCAVIKRRLRTRPATRPQDLRDSTQSCGRAACRWLRKLHLHTTHRRTRTRTTKCVVLGRQCRRRRRRRRRHSSQISRAAETGTEDSKSQRRRQKAANFSAANTRKLVSNLAGRWDWVWSCVWDFNCNGRDSDCDSGWDSGCVPASSIGINHLTGSVASLVAPTTTSMWPLKDVCSFVCLPFLHSTAETRPLQIEIEISWPTTTATTKDQSSSAHHLHGPARQQQRLSRCRPTEARSWCGCCCCWSWSQLRKCPGRPQEHSSMRITLSACFFFFLFFCFTLTSLRWTAAHLPQVWLLSPGDWKPTSRSTANAAEIIISVCHICFLLRSFLSLSYAVSGKRIQGLGSAILCVCVWVVLCACV